MLKFTKMNLRIIFIIISHSNNCPKKNVSKKKLISYNKEQSNTHYNKTKSIINFFVELS